MLPRFVIAVQANEPGTPNPNTEIAQCVFSRGALHFSTLLISQLLVKCLIVLILTFNAVELKIIR